MSSSAFSQYVMSLDDLYEMAQRNGYFLPERSSSAINELMLYNVLQGNYWCPKYADIKLKPCMKPLSRMISSPSSHRSTRRRTTTSRG